MTNCPFTDECFHIDKESACAWMDYMEHFAKRGGILKLKFNPNKPRGEGRWEATPSLFTRKT